MTNPYEPPPVMVGQKPRPFTCRFCGRTSRYFKMGATTLFKGGGAGILNDADPPRWYLKSEIRDALAKTWHWVHHPTQEEINAYLEPGWFGLRVPYDREKRALLLRFLRHEELGCRP
jgi:hypothetical protein